MNLEKRVEYLETVISRLIKRPIPKSKVLTPPQLISSVVKGDINGDLLKATLFRGLITKCVIVFDKRPKFGINIGMSLNEGNEAMSQSHVFSDKKIEQNFNLKTSNGSLLTITAETDKDEIVSEIWLGILWVPHNTVLKADKVLVDDPI
jgi:hypothetical protein